jgi:hypothetical protein
LICWWKLVLIIVRHLWLKFSLIHLFLEIIKFFFYLIQRLRSSVHIWILWCLLIVLITTIQTWFIFYLLKSITSSTTVGLIEFRKLRYGTTSRTLPSFMSWIIIIRWHLLFRFPNTIAIGSRNNNLRTTKIHFLFHFILNSHDTIRDQFHHLLFCIKESLNYLNRLIKTF